MKGLFIPGHKRPESCNDCIANNDCYKCNVLDEVFEKGWADIKPPAECLIFEINTDDWVSRRYLLEEYDRQHVGPPGGARKIIEEAPPALENSDPNEVYSDKSTFERAIKALEFAEEALRQLNRINEQLTIQPAQPERIKGLWIEHDDGITACECSVCHEKYNLYEEDVFGRNFCPNCGADMREEGEDSESD